MTLDISLDAYESIDFDAAAPEIDPLAEIEALDRADRHLQQIARLRHDLAVHDELFQRAMNRLQDRAETRRSIIQRQIEWHQAPVEQLHWRLLESNPKRKTLELPHGTSKVRVNTKPKVWIDDDAAVVDWARNNAPDLLPPPDRVKVTDLRNAVTVAHRSQCECGASDPDLINAWEGNPPPCDCAPFVVLTRHGEVVPGCHAEVPAPTWNVDTEIDL